MSPFSVSTALAMCYAGAKENTAAQMRELLGYQNLSNDEVLKLNGELLANLNAAKNNVELNVANKLFPMTGFDIKKDYTDAVTKHFRTEVHSLDFNKSAESAGVINKWVEEKTNSKIKDLIAPQHLNSLTRLVLVNAIYFKGNWQYQFEKNDTYKEDFHCRDGTHVKVDMMALPGKRLKHSIGPAGLKAECCEIPYDGGDIAMTIILPFADATIEEVEASLTHDKLSAVFAESDKFKVHLFVPKFKLEYQAELSENLKQMGATDAFDQGKANFTGISDISTGLYISKVVHKAFVDVNEEGTEAAAATGVIMMTRCAMPMDLPVEFKCDRPFLFVIHDIAKGNVLFIGKYMKP